MKIACISTSRVPADTANSIQLMKAVHGLAQEGHAVHLLLPEHGLASYGEGSPGEGSQGQGSLRENTDWSSLATQYGLEHAFPIERVPANPRWRHNDFALRAVLRARTLGADLIYTWTIQSAVLGLLAGMPVVYEFHDLPTGRFGPAWFRAFQSLPGKKRLLPITQALRRQAEQLYGAFPEDQVVIAPNGVDPVYYADLPVQQTARRSLGFPERLTVLCSGHLYHGRGGSLFLDLAGLFPLASFIWVGGRTEDVRRYRASAAERGLENVRYTEFLSQHDLPCHLAAADILLMPYEQSVAGSGGGNSADICSPMKMFDYLATGRAILSSDLPVIHEVLNENNAVFAKPNDLQDWSTALGRLLGDADLRSRLSEQARVEAGQYTWQIRAARALAGLLLEKVGS
jgi:glycosyltransferase involved in cell wall biosynthesis